jgi:transposase
MKLIKYNIIKDVFKDTSKFTNNKQKQIYITDTTLIRNKNGIDNISHNPIDNKHNTTKISIVSNLETIIDIKVYDSIVYDSKIFDLQLDSLDNLNNKHEKILLADKAYDSNNLREKLKLKNMRLICPYNKRNTKDINKIKKLSNKEKQLLKKRLYIERINNYLKKCKRLINRYDKFNNNFYNTVLFYSIIYNLTVIDNKKIKESKE